ncbi:hypothetical protein RHGRI_013686 [Rhododendron griersonianum]|uniref:DNA-directed RNA polymerase III subunit RPC6 n=1 Tax=Rhododendron griersonianum TaxID=479676 RepID=A0AAV6K6G8_9ERIC|nr:hypothetical protein RHGRI_013686 [Rhododendron griersonianum]
MEEDSASSERERERERGGGLQRRVGGSSVEREGRRRRGLSSSVGVEGGGVGVEGGGGAAGSVALKFLKSALVTRGLGMSLSQDAMSLKRKRQEPNAQQTKTPGSVLLSLIKSKGGMGIWKADMKRETNLPELVVNKALKILQGRNLIKEVVNVKSKGRKHYMATEFQPSKEVTGGSWYADGVLDIEYIRVLRESCLRIVNKMKVATTEGISEFITRNKITKADCTRQQIEEILSSMVLDNEIIEIAFLKLVCLIVFKSNSVQKLLFWN